MNAANFTELTAAIRLEALFQQEVRSERSRWLRRTSVKPFCAPTREWLIQSLA